MQPDSLGVGNLCDAWHEDGYYRALIRRVSRAPGGNKYGVEFPGYDGVYDLPATLVREKREVQGWMELKTETGGIFFMNETTGETRWKVPEAPMGGIVEEKQKKTTGLVNRMRDTVAQEKRETMTKSQRIDWKTRDHKKNHKRDHKHHNIIGVQLQGGPKTSLKAVGNNNNDNNDINNNKTFPTINHIKAS
ncbi:hypothetical protein TrCOL_g10953 [Triparma columacea]|uniref:WW domain-containing protein n=1 Tax=Triparma columacea TaxID=722753 RepID=A0A9W7GHE9_9STRA|nr:hypothetical protein TrCOL_g10953 [Triparma columacea]